MIPAHPTPDLLADLAAEVLDLEMAERVEAHVIVCADCAGLLADAEQLRFDLRGRDPVGPMPAEVWDKLLAAVEAERATPGSMSALAASTSVGAAPDADTTGLLPSWETSPIGTWDPQSGRYAGLVSSDAASPSPSASPAPSAAPSSGSSAAPSSGFTPGLSLVGAGEANGARKAPRDAVRTRSTSTSRTRRDARDENSPSSRRWVRPLGIAAATIVGLSGVGIVSNRLFDSLGVGSSATSAGGALSAADSSSGPASTEGSQELSPASVQEGNAATQVQGSFASILSNSGKDYTSANMTELVRSLIATNDPAFKVAAGASASAAAGPDITNPQRLQACLKAIEAPDANPIAVDLATYNGQEAAIIVLPGDGGGYEVWAVSRGCSAEAPGLVDFFSIPPG